MAAGSGETPAGMKGEKVQVRKNRMYLKMTGFEFWIGVVFGISFILNFIAGVTIIGRLTRLPGSKEKKTDYNSPRFIGGLLLGFFGGVMANVFLTLFFEWALFGSESSYGWEAFAVIGLAGSIITTILYFMVKVDIDRQALAN